MHTPTAGGARLDYVRRTRPSFHPEMEKRFGTLLRMAGDLRRRVREGGCSFQTLEANHNICVVSFSHSSFPKKIFSSSKALSEQWTGDADTGRVFAGCNSATRQLLLQHADIHFRRRCSTEQPVFCSRHTNDLNSPLHNLQRVKTHVVLMTILLFLTMCGEPSYCLSSRTVATENLLQASLSTEKGFGSVQQRSPAIFPKTPAPWAPTSSPSFATEGKTATSSFRGKSPRHRSQPVPAFLGVTPTSSRDLTNHYRQDSFRLSPAGAVYNNSQSVVSTPRTGSTAATSATSPLAFTTTRLNFSSEKSINGSILSPSSPSSAAPFRTAAAAAAMPASSSISNSSQVSSSSTTVVTPEFDVVIVGLGVGGHAAALHASALGLRTAVVTGGDPGGTCVNRGCVPSKALLAIAKKVKGLRNIKLLGDMGIHLREPRIEIEPTQVAKHAKGVVEKVRGGLVRSLAAHGVTSFEARGTLKGRADRVYLQPVPPLSSSAASSFCVPSSSSDTPLPEYITARNVLLAPGSTPFVPRGVELDEVHNRVMTSDSSVMLPWLPSSVCIVGAGYIGLEFMDVFSSLGSEVTLVDSGPRVLPGVDAEIAKAAERLLLQQFKQRPVTLHRDALASSVRTVTPQQHSSTDNCTQPPLVEVQLIDVKTKEKTKTFYTDACLIATGRVPNTQSLGLDSLGVTLKRGGFVPVDRCMRVTRLPAELAAAEAGGGQQVDASKPEDVIDGLYCIGDANGQMMLAHAASAQGIAAVETIAGRPRVVNVKHIPAACFTSPEIAFVGDTEEAAMKEGALKGFEVGKSVSHFKANTKAIAEGEAEGLLKVLYRKDNGKILGCHMIGMHASDLIQECATAISNDLTVQQLAFTVHTHPTLSEVVDAAWKKAVGMNAH